MKAIILAAGQGKRLLPLTEDRPKCLLPVFGETTALGWQIQELARAGIDDIVVVTGFQHPQVAQAIVPLGNLHGVAVRTLYNPFYAVADNIGSVWEARHELAGDCFLINGDTLFTAAVPAQISAQATTPVTVTIAHKDGYDSDDMKVSLDGRRLTAIGKTLAAADSHAESIGMIRFSGDGGAQFRTCLEDAIAEAGGPSLWYLSVINRLSAAQPVGTVAVPSESWCEVDFPVDLQRARQATLRWAETTSQAAVSL